ncbi:MAG: PEGA domain-containing protein, partial [Candidatus Abyssubacteria bacterium]|nr:PEGA domain-containing protein [Candidatus Abyssubacteria bacterium]
PNIVQIYSVGSHEGMPFFAMEYVRGICLAKAISQKGPLSTGVALNHIKQIAHAVEYAHKKGVIHRDIKPPNILVDSSGRLLVTDFGVSKLLSDETTQDTLGFFGTPQYMSPEQCGQGTLDHRTDIYSMGIVLFEMITGQPVFSSDSPAEIIKKQLFDMPKLPDDFKDKIPAKLQAIISKMLAKEPEKRYPDVSSFLRDLERLDRNCDEPILAIPVAGTAKDKKVKNKQEVVADALGRRARWPVLVFAALVFIGGAAFVLSRGLSVGKGFAFGPTLNALPENEDKRAPVSAQAAAPVADPQPNLPGASPESGPDAAPALSMSSGAAQEVQMAKLVVDSRPPGARVFLDSEMRGKTPLTLADVASGTHVLAMKLEGYPDYSGETLADTAEPLKIFHDFEAAKGALIPRGSLSIDSEPPGAEVYIDGENRGKTPLNMSKLRAAEYSIELRRDGYQTLRKHVTLRRDETLRISLNMVETPKFGGVRISSRPEGAEVLLNGEYKGVTPLSLYRLAIGKYDVLIRKREYIPFRQEIVCEENVTSDIAASLEMTPRFAARQSVIAGDKHLERGELATAIAAYDHAISLDPEPPEYREKLGQAKRSLVIKQVEDLLSSYKFAYDSENTEMLASLLDDEDPAFMADQISNAGSLFREFDNIEVTLSNPTISRGHPHEVVVQLHLGIRAEFAETGLSAQLVDADRTLTVTERPKTGWKISAIK